MTDESEGPDESRIEDEEQQREMLDSLADGAGCVEIWEKLADERGD